MLGLSFEARNTNEQRSRSGLCERVIRRKRSSPKGSLMYISVLLYLSILSLYGTCHNTEFVYLRN